MQCGKNVLMAPHCYLGHEVSPSHGTLQFLTHAESHVDQTVREACSAANKAAANKIVKYGALSASHIFLPVTVETAGTWNQSAIELIQEIVRRINALTEDTRETLFLFHAALIYCSSKGECGRLPGYIRRCVIPRRGRCFCLV